MKIFTPSFWVALVAVAFCGAIALGDLAPDHLKPSPLPLHPASYAEHFPDTAEVLARAVPQQPQAMGAAPVAAPAPTASRY